MPDPQLIPEREYERSSNRSRAGIANQAAHRRLGKRDLEHTIEAAETWIKVAAFACILDRLAPNPTSNKPETKTAARKFRDTL